MSVGQLHRDRHLGGGRRRARRLIGPIVGAFIVNGAKSWLTVAYPEYWLYLLGALFIGVTLFLPDGIVGAGQERKEEVTSPSQGGTVRK